MLLRSDGRAIACGNNFFGQCNIPPLVAGLSYTQVSAGCGYTLLLCSDGSATACGRDVSAECNISALDEGITYTQVSAGSSHSRDLTVLLRSDGTAVATKPSMLGQSDRMRLLQPLQGGVSYTLVSAGRSHCALLRSDGQAETLSPNLLGELSVLTLDSLPLNDGMVYIQVSAGGTHTVLLRSDGIAISNCSAQHSACTAWHFLPLNGLEATWCCSLSR